MAQISEGVLYTVARGLVLAATDRLLTGTAGLDDVGWRAPSRLPGWSRGHVATHLARQADAMSRLAGWARTGVPQPMYASPEDRAAAIEAGSGRSAAELQADLRTAADRLDAAFEEVDTAAAWHAVVELRPGQPAPAQVLPLGRLTEVVVHHHDLDVGFELDAVEATTAEAALQWVVFRLRDREGMPALLLTADSGLTLSVAGHGAAHPVGGSSAALLGWLTGRTAGTALTGTDGLTVPPL